MHRSNLDRTAMVCVSLIFALAGCRDPSREAKMLACEQTLLSQQQETRMLEEQVKALQAQLKEQNTKIERLLADLSNAKDEAQRAALQKQLDELQGAKKKPGLSSTPRTKAQCGCKPDDPLCS